MNLVRFQPWSVADLMPRDFNRPNTACVNGDYGQTPSANWVPAVDIIEEKDSFVLRADLPGVMPEDIEVSMDDGVLAVAGERRIEGQEDSDELRRIEPVVRDGGYIPGCDHGVPSDVSWPNFVDYARLLAKMTGWL